MYTRAQKESSSVSATSIHKKSNGSDGSRSFSVQRQPEINSSQEKDIPSYSRDAANSLAANVMRSMEEGKDSDEMSLEAGVQTKLTVGAPGDKYEQEADQVAAQVISMSVAPDNSPQVQRVEEEDSPVQRWSLAQSITPVVQRRVDEQVQMRSVVQRAFQAGGNEASGDLEGRLHGSKGGGSALAPEVRAFMEPRFGADFSGVRVHTGGEAVQMNRELGAQAFTHGSDVYFGAGKSPGNNELTAHELTHVVQQTGNIQPRIQRYQIQKDFRISDDGKIAVHQADPIGGQTAYATPELLKDASDKLKAATSVIKLKKGSLSTKLSDLDGNKHDVVDVVPVNTQNKTEDLNMELWADCGRAAKTVSGIDQGTGQGNASPGAKYNKDGTAKTVFGNDWMDIQKVKMFRDIFRKENSWWEFWKPKYKSMLDLSTIDKKLNQYNTLKQNWITEADNIKRDALSKQMSRLASELDVLSRAEYEKLDPTAKDDFDKKAGINMYADPEIGEAFHISTGGNEHPHKPADVGTWNFHWAGVVMKSGSDTMTLENYSVSDYEEENKDWVFQMYGVGKKGQSFHEEHKDVHKQHGDAPTSMVAIRRRKYQKE